MTYGTIKVDTVTFTDAGVDKSVTLSGLVQNPVFSGNVTVTGTLSGVTVTGTTANFTSGNFTNISGGTHTITSGVFAAGSAASPSITFTGDLNTGIYSPGADQVAISTNGTKRIEIQADGDIDIDNGGVFYDATNNRLAIGTSTPNVKTEVSGTEAAVSLRVNSQNAGVSANNYSEVQLADNGALRSYWRNVRDGSGSTQFAYNSSLAFLSDANGTPTERFRCDTSGRLLVGTSTSIGSDSKLQLKDGFFNIYHGTTAGLGAGYGILFSTDGGATARVKAYMGLSETAGFGGNLAFSTTADGASSPTERMRITSAGFVLVGNTSVFSINSTSTGLQLASDGSFVSYASATPVAYFSRQTNDGTIIDLRQDGISEGSISVSGTTVSYNGAHLSRWSQLPSGAERTEILRGSVLSNIDEMCEWGEEDNEQLNRMKVSDVEGDKNVSGVFQAWDDDDDTYTNDFYCAMTGDFIIRIAQGVTVERGDLLMSAGDGTAKPQDDDIIRSKTIAKVTSTNVSCTYEDGSYCVPCVLMAC